MAGVVMIKSPIRLSWRSKIFTAVAALYERRISFGGSETAAPNLSRHSHRDCICIEQSRAEMVPGKIFNDPAPRRSAHLFNRFRMSIEIFERGRDRIDVSRPDNNSLDLIAHDIARFPSGDLRQTAGRRFIRDFGASLPLRGKDVHRALAEITLRIADKPQGADVIAPEFLQIRLRFLMHRTDQPELSVWQIQAMPGFEHMVNAFAFDQRAGKNRAEFCRALSGFE